MDWIYFNTGGEAGTDGLKVELLIYILSDWMVQTIGESNLYDPLAQSSILIPGQDPYAVKFSNFA